jgi:hydrogenase maturation protease
MTRRGRRSGASGGSRLASPPAAAKRTLILYLGNPIVRNDQVGLIAGARLARELAGRPGVEVRKFGGSPLDLVSHLDGYRRLILIDSIWTGTKAPATVVLYREQELLAQRGDAYPHGLNLPEAIRLARALELPLPAEIALIGIETGPITRFGEGLDAELADRLEETCAEVERLVRELIAQ